MLSRELFDCKNAKNVIVSSSHQKYKEMFHRLESGWFWSGTWVPSKASRRHRPTSTVVNVHWFSETTRCLGVWLVFWNLVSHFRLHLWQFLFVHICLNWSAALFSTSKQNRIKNDFKRKQNLFPVVSQVNLSQCSGTTKIYKHQNCTASHCAFLSFTYVSA